MPKPFSKRNLPAPDVFTYKLERKARQRILNNLGSFLWEHREQINPILARAALLVLNSNGELKGTDKSIGFETLRLMNHQRNGHFAALNHFYVCDDEESLDFIEFLMRCVTPWQRIEDCVTIVNSVFQEEGVGYELTLYREIKKENSDCLNGYEFETVYPEIIKKDGQYIHEEVIRPCLEVLRGNGLEVANQEMLKAHEAYRKGLYADVITDVGAALESVLKTICTNKGWKFDPDKDSLAALVRACKDNGLFPPFYDPILVSAGTIRNKLSDAHGRGPNPSFVANKEFADHMMQITSAHITLLVKLAGL